MKSLVACPSNLEICCGCNLIDLISFKWVSLFIYWSFFFEIKGLMKRWSRILPSLFHPLSRPPCFLQWQRRYVMSLFCKFGFMWRRRTLQSWSVFKLPLAAWAQLSTLAENFWAIWWHCVYEQLGKLSALTTGYRVSHFFKQLGFLLPVLIVKGAIHLVKEKKSPHAVKVLGCDRYIRKYW